MVLDHGPDLFLRVEVDGGARGGSGSPTALVPGWADMRATCEEVAVGLSPALVPGWADMGATCEASPWESCSILVAIVARAVVKVPRICLTSIRVALSSGLMSY